MLDLSTEKGAYFFFPQPKGKATSSWKRFSCCSCEVQCKGSGVEACADKELFPGQTLVCSMGQAVVQWGETPDIIKDGTIVSSTKKYFSLHFEIK